MSSARHPTGMPIQKIYADRYARKKGCGKISAPPPQNSKPMNPTISDRLCKRSHRASDTSPFMACSRGVDVDLSGRRRGWNVSSVAFFFLMLRRPTRSTLFPYTTLYPHHVNLWQQVDERIR